MTVFDSIGVVRSLRRTEWTKSLIVLTVLYSLITVGLITIVVVYAPSRFPRNVETPPAMRTGDEIIAQTQSYLKTAVHHGFSGTEPEASICFDAFEGETFEVEYLITGIWRVNAWHERVRYFWRVNDETLEVTQDEWFKTQNPTIDC